MNNPQTAGRTIMLLNYFEFWYFSNEFLLAKGVASGTIQDNRKALFRRLLAQSQVRERKLNTYPEESSKLIGSKRAKREMNQPKQEESKHSLCTIIFSESVLSLQRRTQLLRNGY